MASAVAQLENGVWRKASLGLKMAPIHPLLENRVGLATSQASVNVDQVELGGIGVEWRGVVCAVAWHGVACAVQPVLL